MTFVLTNMILSGLPDPQNHESPLTLRHGGLQSGFGFYKYDRAAEHQREARRGIQVKHGAVKIVP